MMMVVKVFVVKVATKKRLCWRFVVVGVVVVSSVVVGGRRGAVLGVSR